MKNVILNPIDKHSLSSFPLVHNNDRMNGVHNNNQQEQEQAYGQETQRLVNVAELLVRYF